MYCSNCGKEIEGGSKFCGYCGASVEKSAIEAKRVQEEPSELERKEAVERFKKRTDQYTVEGKGMPKGTEYAGFWRRFVAYFIDGIILNIVTWIIMGIFSWISPAVASVMGIIVGIVYFVAFWTLAGQTPGKMAMGVEIVNADGNHIGIGGAILRYVGYLISGLILCIGFLMIALDSKKQGLHDKIARTYVVKT